MKNTLTQVMAWKYHGKQYTIRDGALSEWNEPTPAPTQQELDAADAELTTLLSNKTNAQNAVFNAINSRLGIPVASLDDLKGKKASVYDAIDAKEEQVVNGPGTADQKLNQLRQIWNARNKIESLLS